MDQAHVKFSKQKIIEQACADIAGELVIQRREAMNAVEAATHEEAKPENDKDTRSIEAAYFAGAQAERVAALETLATELRSLKYRAFGPDDAVALTALVGVESARGKQVFFLSPKAGGRKVVVEGQTIQFLTPRSPLGRALLGAEVGGDVAFQAPGQRQEFEIFFIE